MSDCTRDNIEAIARLRTITNQIGEVIDWIGETDSGLEAIRRIQSIQAELRQISVRLVENHLASCVVIALQPDSTGVSNALDEIYDMFRCVNWIDL